MAKSFLTHINLNGNELQNGNLQNLAAAPGSPTAGRIYYDTVKKGVGFYTGSAWVYPTESGGVSEAEAGKLGTIMVKGDLGGTGTSPTVVHFTLSSNSAAGGNKITGLGEPTGAGDAVTKAYVDAKLNGVSWKNPVRLATFVALPAYTASGSGAAHILTANANGTLTVDGKLTVLGNRILLKNGASGKDNGIYTVTTEGTAGAKFILTRAVDFVEESQILDATVVVEDGSEYQDHIFNLTNNPTEAVVDTNELTWVEIQNGVAVVGDEVYTKRVGNKIQLIPLEAAAAEPADGAVSAISKGAARKVVAAIKGDTTKTEFTITHELKSRNLVVSGQENNAGNPTTPVEFDWETSGAEKIILKFPTAPGKTTYHVTIVG